MGERMDHKPGRLTDDNLTMSMSFQDLKERDTAPTLGEGKSLLTTNVTPGNRPETCGNYGALNNSREHRSECGHDHPNQSLDDIESCSDMQSVLGESVLYHEHVSQYTLERS